jgi:DNA-directed RNA polymerase specialized sigma24 family protein
MPVGRKYEGFVPANITDLVPRVVADDPQARDELARILERPVRGMLRRQFRDKIGVDDVAQEAITKLTTPQKLSTFHFTEGKNPQSHFQSWAMRVAFNTGIDAARRVHRDVSLDENQDSVQVSSSEEVRRTVLPPEIIRQKIAERIRELLTGKSSEEMIQTAELALQHKHEDVARILSNRPGATEVTRHAVDTRISRVVQIIRPILGQAGYTLEKEVAKHSRWKVRIATGELPSFKLFGRVYVEAAIYDRFKAQDEADKQQIVKLQEQGYVRVAGLSPRFWQLRHHDRAIKVGNNSFIPQEVVTEKGPPKPREKRFNHPPEGWEGVRKLVASEAMYQTLMSDIKAGIIVGIQGVEGMCIKIEDYERWKQVYETTRRRQKRQTASN